MTALLNDGERAGVCTGPGPCDVAPLGLGKNWVTRVGGLPLYLRAIAHALRRQGHSESAAIATAVATAKRWAAGGGNVTAETRARAGKAVAEWEAKKAAAHVHGDRGLTQDDDSYREGVSDRLAGRPAQKEVEFLRRHPGHDPDDWPLYVAGYKADRNDLHLVAGSRQFAAVAATEGSSAGLLLPKGPSERQAEEIIEKEKRRRLREGQPHAFRGKDVEHCNLCQRNATDHIHLVPAEQKRSWTFDPSETRVPSGNSTGGEWGSFLNALRQRYGRRLDVYESPTRLIVRRLEARNPSEAVGILQALGYEADRHGRPLAISPKAISGGPPGLSWLRENGFYPNPGKTIEDEDPFVRFPHGTKPAWFDDDDLRSHGKRHGGVGHKPVQSGHVAGDYRRRRKASSASFLADADELEPKFLSALQDLIARQETAVLVRLQGKRGRQALRSGNRAAPANPQGQQSAPAQPAPQLQATLSGVTPPPNTAATALGAFLAGFPAAVAARAVALAEACFDVAFWGTATAAVLLGLYRLAEQKAIARVDAELGLSATEAEAAKAAEPATTPATTAAKAADIAEEAASAAAAIAEVPAARPASPGEILRLRANRMAASVTETTFRQIAEALATGLERGESISELANDVRAAFDATRTRAETIARTEVIGALNEAANAQAEWLGTEFVARKEWLAHEDLRTRPAHRLADGQTVPLKSPFFVGGVPMQFPGDPAAPPDLVVNCRCGLAFLPPGAERIPR